MKLNRLTKHDVKIGDRLRFASGQELLVINVISGGDRYGRAGAVSFTLRFDNGQVLYAYPSSQLYGAEIIKNDMEG